jgi:hypothetical protein
MAYTRHELHILQDYTLLTAGSGRSILFCYNGVGERSDIAHPSVEILVLQKKSDGVRGAEE